MGRNAAVPTGLVRLTDEDLAFLNGDESRPGRPIARAVAVAMMVLYRHHVSTGPEMFDRALRAQLVASLPMNGFRLPTAATERLAKNALATAAGNGLMERVWAEDVSIHRYRLTDEALRIAEEAWGEQAKAYMEAVEEQARRAALEAELVPSHHDEEEKNDAE